MGPGGYVSGNPAMPPSGAHPHSFPGQAPLCYPLLFNGEPYGVWVGRGAEAGQGPGIPKKTARAKPSSGVGGAKGMGARILRGPIHPVKNSSGEWVGYHYIRCEWLRTAVEDPTQRNCEDVCCDHHHGHEEEKDMAMPKSTWRYEHWGTMCVFKA